MINRTRITTWVALAFLLLTSPFTQAQSSPQKAIFDAVEKIVVIGDIHGDFERLVETLRVAKVVDEKDRWIAGKIDLVQLGDLPDRGPDTLKAIDYLQKLQKKARRKGGRVHLLIGNHEAMNVYGDLRYVTDEEFTAFTTKNSDKHLERLYQSEVQWIKDNQPEEDWPTFNEAHREKWFKFRPTGFLEHRINWLPNGKIGSWVSNNNTILKIGRNLFMHGGLGPLYADWSIDSINTEVRNSFNDLEAIDNSIIRSEDGPLWYRGLSLNPEDTEIEHVDTLLKHFDVDRIILGHTVTKGVILPRFNGKVIITDVGLSRYYGEHLACLVIEKDRLIALHRTGEVEIPSVLDEAQLIEYLKSVSKLEPENKSILRRIADLEDLEKEDQLSTN